MVMPTLRKNKMIKIKYLVDCKGLERFGNCISCGKSSKEDLKMVRVRFSPNENKATSICLCDECRRLLYEKI